MSPRGFERAIAACIAAISLCSCGGLIAPGTEDDGGSARDAARDGDSSDAAIDPCTSASCETPPSDICVDQSTARTYLQSGTCSFGNCGYSYTDFACRYGCDQGACVPPP